MEEIRFNRKHIMWRAGKPGVGLPGQIISLLCGLPRHGFSRGRELEELSIVSLFAPIVSYAWHTVLSAGFFLLPGPYPSLGALTMPRGAGESYPLQHFSTALGTCL